MLVSGDLGGNVTGDINKDQPLYEKEIFIKKIGAYLADLTRQALDEHGVWLDGKKIEHVWAPVEFVMESDTFEFAFKMGLLNKKVDFASRKIPSEVHAMRLGELSFVTVPGEIFPSLGVRIRDAAAKKGAAATMIIGLCPEELAYMMTPEEFKNPQYAYDAEVSLGEKTGVIWLDAAKALFEKLGDLKK